MLNNKIKTEHYALTFDIPCSTFCGSLLTVGEVRTKPQNPFRVTQIQFTDEAINPWPNAISAISAKNNLGAALLDLP